MAGPGLGWPEVGMAADVVHRLGDGDRAAQRIHPLGAQPEQLAGSQPAVGGKQDGRSAARVHGIGQRHHFARIEEAHLHSLNAGQPYAVARRLREVARLHSRAHDLAEELGRLGRGRRGQPRRTELDHPRPHHHVVDLTELEAPASVLRITRATPAPYRHIGAPPLPPFGGQMQLIAQSSAVVRNKSLGESDSQQRSTPSGPRSTHMAARRCPWPGGCYPTREPRQNP